MKTLISILIMLLSIQEVTAQENTARKDFLFENQVTKSKIKIEIGDKVSIRFKTPDATITGTILFLSDSSLILSTSQESHRQLIPLWNIKVMNVIRGAKKRYVVSVRLIIGKRLRGELIRTMKDSLTIANRLKSHGIGVSEIKSIQIHGKGSVGRRLGIGAGTGFLLGGIIGYASYTPTYTCRGCAVFDDALQAGSAAIGAVFGGVAGLVVGAVVGLSSDKEFKIDGNQARFDLFVNEFAGNKLSPEKSK